MRMASKPEPSAVHADKPDLDQARQFLQLLGSQDPATVFHFRTFADNATGGAGLRRKFSGSLTEPKQVELVLRQLAQLNCEGAGIFVVVNAGGQRKDEITSVRAVFADFDGASPSGAGDPLTPHMVVESSPGRYHLYWLVKDLPVARFGRVQEAIAAKYSSDPAVRDLPRVMRVPGFYHHKREPFQSRLLAAEGHTPFSAQEAIGAFGTAEVTRESIAEGRIHPKATVTLASGRQLDLPDMRSGIGPFAQPAFPGTRHIMLVKHVGSRFSEGRTLDEVMREARGWNLGNPDPLDDVELTNTVADIYQRHTQHQISEAGRVQWGEPEPLVRDPPPPEPYPVHALGSMLAAAAMAMHDAIQAPLAVCSQSVLAAASLAAQGHADVTIDGRTAPLSLWAITVAESGERKSAVDAEALRAHKDYERDEIDHYKAAQRAFVIEQAAFEKARSAATGRGKDRAEGRDAIQKAIAAVGAPPDPPLLPYLTATEPTLEGVHKLLELGRPAIGLFSDEGGQFFGGHAMSREHATKTAAGLSRLWDGGRIDRVRAGDGASILHGRRLSMHLMLQPVIAESVLSDPLLAGQGLLARCLLAWPESTAGHRPYREVNLLEDFSMKQYWVAMRNLLVQQLPLRVGTRNELEPIALALAPEAKRVWIEAYNKIESAMPAYAQVRPFASKAAEQALRIAGVLTLVAEPRARVIDVHNIRNAIALVAWHLGEAVRLAGTASTSPGVRNAMAVLSWCTQRAKKVVHSAELVRTGPGCVREAAAVHAAMSELVRAGWAMPADGLEVDGRKRRRAWRLHPHISS